MKRAENKPLHIIAFDIPVPVNYGGAIDIYYKLQALSELGVRIHLHCFQYGREKAPELEQYCAQVSYYQRIRWPWLHLSRRPFIISSRKSISMLSKLMSDDAAILFEGLHTTRWLDHSALKDRHKIVRTHNIEHQYYLGLAKAERNWFKRTYFKRESRKLKSAEKILVNATGIAAISINDQHHFEKFHENIKVVSAFHADTIVSSSEGKGEFALYHGSLDVSENDNAARWLISEVFNDLEIPLIIAGNRASQSLRDLIAEHEHIHLRENIGTDEIYSLVNRAHMNVLPTFQATGIKLKLLAALFKGRHCVVNEPMVKDTGLEHLCIVCEDASAMKQVLKDTWNKPFESDSIKKRKKCLEDGKFSNRHNAKKLAKMLFPNSSL